MTGGDFSQEAYEALRQSYAAQLQTNVELETAGVEVHGQKMTVETLPVDSPWQDKIEQWTYPSGKSAYVDGEQKTPEEVLEVMRAAATEKMEARAEVTAKEEETTAVQEKLDGMSEEEFDKFVDDLLAEPDTEETEAALEDPLDDEVEEEDAVDAPVAEAEVEEEEVSEEESYPDAETIADEIAALRAELEGLAFNNEE